MPIALVSIKSDRFKEDDLYREYVKEVSIKIIDSKFDIKSAEVVYPSFHPVCSNKQHHTHHTGTLNTQIGTQNKLLRKYLAQFSLIFCQSEEDKQIIQEFISDKSAKILIIE
jgi:hypothetical protein